jgi:predicted nucleic acid-binding Zn ribbon protein
MEEKLCLNCGGPVGPGRKDKKYCSEACKTEYNNRQKEPPVMIPDFIPEINKFLLNNWKILHDCLGNKDTCKMRVRDLSGRNYNFKFFTAERVNDQDEEVYYFCYDVGYKLVEDGDKVIIVQSDNMVRLNGPAHV